MAATIEEKEQIRNILENNVAQVTFIKKNGVHRIMNCTLIKEVLPETEGESQSNDDRLCVWNIDLDHWRSFRYNLVERIVWMTLENGQIVEHVWTPNIGENLG